MVNEEAVKFSLTLFIISLLGVVAGGGLSLTVFRETIKGYELFLTLIFAFIFPLSYLLYKLLLSSQKQMNSFIKRNLKKDEDVTYFKEVYFNLENFKGEHFDNAGFSTVGEALRKTDVKDMLTGVKLAGFVITSSHRLIFIYQLKREEKYSSKYRLILDLSYDDIKYIFLSEDAIDIGGAQIPGLLLKIDTKDGIYRLSIAGLGYGGSIIGIDKTNEQIRQAVMQYFKDKIK